LIAVIIATNGGCKSRSELSALHTDGRFVGGFLSPSVIESKIRTRLLHQFESERGLGFASMGGGQIGSLVALLGTYDGRPTQSALQGASPSAVNLLLWELTLRPFSTAISH